MGIKFANSAFATLASGINSSATSITLTTGQGARFPSLSAGDYFYATLIDTSNNLEIVKCTARSTDVLTVTRGQESTTARAFSTGDRIELRITAQGIADASGNLASGTLDIPGTSASGAIARLYEDTDNGTHYVGLKAAASIASSIDFTLPSADGTNGQYLQTNGSGGLSFSTVTIPPSVIVAYRASVTTTQETRANSQGAAFLISSSAYMSGLTAITHTCASASNYVLLKLVMPVGGNATGDGAAVAFSVDGTCPGGGALASSNTTGSECRDNVQVLHTIVYPNDTSSHVYRVNWCSAINGASQTCNSMVRTVLGTQTLFELWEVSPAGTAGSIYTV